MALCHDHPVYGVYARGEVIGGRGDFVTAPEVSQMFGELIGLWLVEAWRGLGAPGPLHLIELGPGRGTLMVDLLRVTRRVPGFQDQLAVHLVEPSAALRSRQATALRGRIEDDRLIWHPTLAEVPEGPWLLIANEVLDALPARQLAWHEGAWRERKIALADDGQLRFEIDPAPVAVSEDLPAPGPKTIHEISPARSALAEALGKRLCRHPGVAILIDYGASGSGPTGDTWQAVRAHGVVDPLLDPGTADLSTQVDFTAFARAARDNGGAVYGPVPQGVFLRALGIEARALKLMADVPPATRHDVRTALFRLTDASAMGEAFKVLVLAPPEVLPPPGFLRPTP